MLDATLPNTPELTLCTVSFGHQDFLLRNHTWCTQLNANWVKRVRWLIADNAPLDSTARLQALPAPYEIVPVQGELGHGASHHHGSALNRLLAHAKTRYVLILDPDFFLLAENWLTNVISYLNSTQLAFFGVPWHPRYYENYRYFPAVHCLFIDTEQVPLSELDFSPYNEDQKRQEILAEAPFGLSRIPALAARHRISWDTGSRVYDHVGMHTKLRSECAIPVCRDTQWMPEQHTWRSRIYDLFLPEAYCRKPKRQNSYRTAGLAEQFPGLPPFPIYWDEMYWNNQPFGLHVRHSFNAKQRDRGHEYETLLHILDALTQLTTIQKSS